MLAILKYFGSTEVSSNLFHFACSFRVSSESRVSAKVCRKCCSIVTIRRKFHEDSGIDIHSPAILRFKSLELWNFCPWWNFSHVKYVSLPVKHFWTCRRKMSWFVKYLFVANVEPSISPRLASFPPIFRKTYRSRNVSMRGILATMLR